MSVLVACSSCRRHFFAHEARCPFCAAPAQTGEAAPTGPTAQAASTTQAGPTAQAADAARPRAARAPAGLSRAAQLAWKVTLGGAGVAACATPAPGARSTGDAPVEVRIPDADFASAPDASDAPDAGAEAPASDGDLDAGEPRVPRRVVAIYGTTTIRILEHIRFGAGDTSVGGRAESAVLDAVAEALKHNPELRVCVEGHADSREHGAAKLSTARARHVARELVARGVAKDRLRVRSFGATRPLSGTEDAKNNRRVSFTVLEEGEDAGAPLP